MFLGKQGVGGGGGGLEAEWINGKSRRVIRYLHGGGVCRGGAAVGVDGGDCGRLGPPTSIQERSKNTAVERGPATEAPWRGMNAGRRYTLVADMHSGSIHGL